MIDIKEFRRRYNLSVEDVGKIIGVSPNTIRSWEGATNPRNPTQGAIKLLQLYEEKHLKKSLILKDDIIRDVEEETDTDIQVLPAESPVQIPYYDIDFAGGWSSDEIFSTVNPSFYINSPDFHRAEFACNLVGHSISRLIPIGSVIGLRDIQDWQTYFPTNELYGIVMENGLRTVKIVKRNREDKNTLILLPDCLPEYDKTGYEPEEVPINFIVKLYQVTAWAKFQRLTM